MTFAISIRRETSGSETGRYVNPFRRIEYSGKSGLELREEGHRSVRPDRTYDPDVVGCPIVAQHLPRNRESFLAWVIDPSQEIEHRPIQLCEMNLAMMEFQEAIPPARLVVTCSSVLAQPGWARSALTLESLLLSR